MALDLPCMLGFHDWGRWKDETPCIQVRKCRRCEYEQVKLKYGGHDWGEWEYEKRGSCVQVRKCTRCGLKDTETRGEHSWGEWEHVYLRCARIRTCKRCSAQEREEVHDWEYEWASGGGVNTRKCRVCGLTEQMPSDS